MLSPHESPRELSCQAILQQLNRQPSSAFARLQKIYGTLLRVNILESQMEFYKAVCQWHETHHDEMSLYWIARCRMNGWDSTKEPVTGFSQLITLASAGCLEAQYYVAMVYLHGMSITGAQELSIQVDKKTAYDWLKLISDCDPIAGSSSTQHNNRTRTLISLAQYHLAEMLSKGNGVPEDTQQAFQLFVKSANHGNKYAQYITGYHYAKGLFVEENTEQAKYYFLQSARQDFSEAQAAVGIMLVDESCTEEGLLWLQRAVHKDNPRAMLKLAMMYETGQGVPHNDALALDYYMMAARRCDHPVANYVLGLNYRLGQLGLEKNYQEASKYLTRSARAGFPSAQRLLGLMYAQELLSTGGENSRRKNEKIALIWFRRAASRGDVRALGLVGSFYEHGQGTTSNFEIALQYYHKAARIVSPFQGAAQLAMAMLLHRMGRYHDAYQWFTLAATPSPTEAAHLTCGYRRKAQLMVARYKLHGWIESLKDPKAAFHMLTDMATQSDTDGSVHYWLAACYEEGIHDVCDPDLEKAFQHYMVAAKTGDTDGEFQVALMLSNGQGVPCNRKDAYTWYEKAAQKGHRTALYSLGLYHAKGLAGCARSLDQARTYFEKAAQLGLPKAMTSLATTYRLTATPQLDKSIYWYKKAAALDDVTAQRELGILYDAGTEVPQNHRLAYEYLEKAAKHKDSQAMLLLGSYYQNGLIVTKDYDQAIQLYLEASAFGSAIASFAAAQLYHQLKQFDNAFHQYWLAANDQRLASSRIGNTAKLMVARYILSYVPLSTSTLKEDADHSRMSCCMQTKEEAFQMMFDLASEAHFGPSFYWLADCYFHGHGVSPDPIQAIYWYKRAVEENNHAEAMMKLADIYAHGQGIEKNERLAYQYLQQSAEGGHAQAQHELGITLWQGRYQLQPDLAKAVAWLTRSAAQKWPESHYVLGQMAMDNGDRDVALAWWHKASDLGHVLSMRTLALALLDQEKDLDLSKVARLLSEAGKSGDAESLIFLGQLHQNGSMIALRHQARATHLEPIGDDDSEEDDGTNTLLQDQEEEQTLAIQYFEQAARMGHVKGMFLAAQAWHAQQQYAAALEHYEHAASRGHILAKVMRARYRLAGLGGLTADPATAYKELLACAQDEQCADAYNSLGQCHELGLGTEQNDQQAITWYVASAEATRDAEAMYRIGRLYAQRRITMNEYQEETSYQNDLEAMRWYLFASDTQHHANALYQLGLYYMNGITCQSEIIMQPDIGKALHCFQQAAEQRHQGSMFQLGYHLVYEEALVAEEQRMGVLWLDRAAEMGFREAQRELGKLYHTGKDHGLSGECIVVQNFEKAYDLFCRAAQQEDLVATLFLGSYNEHGIHVPPSPEYAKEWYEIAIKLGRRLQPPDPDTWLAELALAHLLHQDESQRREAWLLYQNVFDHAPAEQKDGIAITLARYRLYGWGNVTPDPEYAAQKLIEYATNGATTAFLDVAQCFELGNGVQQSWRQAFMWYDRVVRQSQQAATEQGVDDDNDDAEDDTDEEDVIVALLKMAEFYRKGMGMPVNLQKAQELYRLAASKGTFLHTCINRRVGVFRVVVILTNKGYCVQVQKKPKNFSDRPCPL
ncbi:uncharacterized protein BYT42DRAFT_499505 [Radiomyces spectabilis]|uniref:uncharacterized protein n=1 Tax=Radiomyces spectabilis TaxID=64574 RepID=UPI0022209E20|nr:uncharacterized protein BYT42DRAFT_499505 [Radiomyces spectabilis]KAI8374477.1 hypothetical protein BYT42DRAFT_499505 [Radiomyces spectabilis]